MTPCFDFLINCGRIKVALQNTVLIKSKFSTIIYSDVLRKTYRLWLFKNNVF